MRGARSEVRYGYDSGCFRPPGGAPGDASVREVALALGLTLEEVSEPGGCPATGHAMNGIPAYARVGRLLTLAARQLAGRRDARFPPTFVTPCSACFLSLSRASRTLGTHEDLRQTVAEELAAAGLVLERGPVLVRHLLDVLGTDAGPEAFRARVARPLSGLRVAPYYGCLAPREGAAVATAGDGPGRPRPLEEILLALGAEVVDFPLKDHCCGGRAAEASEETATSLQVRILRSVAERGADVVAVACPRCERSLSSGQDAVNRRYGTTFAIPVRYFTALAADAFGLGDARPAPS
jgi:heterodisulfide reductase subunit B2